MRKLGWGPAPPRIATTTTPALRSQAGGGETECARILEESPRYDSPVQTRRPMHFFRPDGPVPDEVEMRLTIQLELGPEAELLAELRERVHAVEAEYEAERQRTGRQQVLGRRAVLQQPCCAYPSTAEPRRNLRPRVAGRSKWSRIEALLRNRAFIEEYARLGETWREGRGFAFPQGTYWLRRFANVVVAEA